MSNETASLWFSNYANLAIKAHRPKLAASFTELSEVYAGQARKNLSAVQPDQKALLGLLEDSVKHNASTAYPLLQQNAGGNRGALRAFTWGSKVATILKSIIGRVATKGDAILGEGQAFFVCDACGFMFVGGEAPAICPICKAPAARFARY